jgi:hypothetical protein
MVSCCLSATGIRFSVILFPPRSWAPLTVGLPNTPKTCTDLDGVSPFRTHELRPARAPSKPRGQRCSPRPRRLPAGRRPHLSSQSLHPAALPIDRGRITRHSEGSRNSPVRSSPRLWPPGWNGPPLGFPPGFAPRRPRAGRRTPGWGQAIEHGPGTTRSTHSSISNPVVHSLCATSGRTSPLRSSGARSQAGERNRPPNALLLRSRA